MEKQANFVMNQQGKKANENWKLEPEYLMLKQDVEQAINKIRSLEERKQQIENAKNIFKTHLDMYDRHENNVSKVWISTPLAMIELKDHKLDIKNCKERIKEIDLDLQQAADKIEMAIQHRNVLQKTKNEYEQDKLRRDRAHNYKDEQRHPKGEKKK